MIKGALASPHVDVENGIDDPKPTSTTCYAQQSPACMRPMGTYQVTAELSVRYGELKYRIKHPREEYERAILMELLVEPAT